MNRVWFIDRNLGKRFPSLLAEAGLAVERHDDVFPPDGSDEQWLSHCGAQRRVAITQDIRIRYVPNELAALRHFAVQMVVVVGKVPTVELARNFIATRDRIEAWLDRQPGPAILKVYRPAASELARSPGMPGRVELWYPKA